LPHEHHRQFISGGISEEIPPIPPPPPTQSQLRRQRRLDRYQQVVDLFNAGQSQAAISRTLGIERKTVRRWLRCRWWRLSVAFRHSPDDIRHDYTAADGRSGILRHSTGLRPLLLYLTSYRIDGRCQQVSGHRRLEPEPAARRRISGRAIRNAMGKSRASSSRGMANAGSSSSSSRTGCPLAPWHAHADQRQRRFNCARARGRRCAAKLVQLRRSFHGSALRSPG
jgi:hypothetical protein